MFQNHKSDSEFKRYLTKNPGSYFGFTTSINGIDFDVNILTEE